MINEPMKAGAPQATAAPPTSPTSRSEQKQPEKAPRKARSWIHPPAVPVLRFTPTAWAKLLFFRDRQETEIGGFALSAPDDLLKVVDFLTVKQQVTMASVSFDDQAVADFFEAQVDARRKPEQFARTWLHTHPGDCPQPSSTDEETFARVFGACQWAVMFVLARGGKSYARLRFNTGPGGSIVIPVDVDFTTPFGPSQQEAWEAEYKANIDATPFTWGLGAHDEFDRDFGGSSDLTRCSVPDDWMEGLEAMEPAERQLILDELSARPDLWAEGQGGLYG